MRYDLFGHLILGLEPILPGAAIEMLGYTIDYKSTW